MDNKKYIKCISNEFAEELFTVGNMYEVVKDFKTNYIEVIDDTGANVVATKDRFCMETEVEVFHSNHYESDSIEPIEFIMSNNLDFCRGNIVKYGFRAGKKQGQEALDIKKIIDYSLLLAIQEGISISRDDIVKLVDYRFKWKESR